MFFPLVWKNIHTFASKIDAMDKKVTKQQEKTCYSPEELQEFKELILSKIAKAERDPFAKHPR